MSTIMVPDLEITAISFVLDLDFYDVWLSLYSFSNLMNVNFGVPN